MLTTRYRSSTYTFGAMCALFALHIAILPSHSYASSADTDECNVVLLGASYAKDWPISRIEDYLVTNKGIGGNQSFEMADRFDVDVIDQDADAVIIWGFINDIFRAPPEQVEDAKLRIRDSFSQMISLSIENGITPIVATEISIREADGFLNWVAGIIGRVRGKTSYQTIINQHVSETNANLLELAAAHNVEVLDFFDLLADEDGMRHHEYAAEDGSHISAAGYAELTRYVTESFPVPCRPSE